MGEIKTEKAGGRIVQSVVSKETARKFTKACKDNNTSKAQVIRDYVQNYVKRNYKPDPPKPEPKPGWESNIEA